jgi:hypothetical protein
MRRLGEPGLVNYKFLDSMRQKGTPWPSAILLHVLAMRAQRDYNAANTEGDRETSAKSLKSTSIQHQLNVRLMADAPDSKSGPRKGSPCPRPDVFNPLMNLRQSQEETPPQILRLGVGQPAACDLPLDLVASLKRRLCLPLGIDESLARDRTSHQSDRIGLSLLNGV